MQGAITVVCAAACAWRMRRLRAVDMLLPDAVDPLPRIVDAARCTM